MQSAIEDGMQLLGPYVEEAIPHEAGHILVGKALGLPPRGLDVNVVRLPNNQGIEVGDFATLAWEVPDEEIPKLDPELKARLTLFISGGIAGQLFARIPFTGKGGDEDRRQLARLTKDSIEHLANLVQPMFHKRRRIFWQLVALIRRRYTELTSNRDIQTGTHPLLTEDDIHEIFVANSTNPPKSTE
jgi:hypothetical protein